MTIGEDRVRAYSFDASENPLVIEIKTKTAELIDLCEAHKGATASEDDVERDRLWLCAQNQYEDAAMWAVKAATA